MEALAEGIESEVQLAKLQSMGCDCGQGFLFSPAKEPQAITHLFEAIGQADDKLAAWRSLVQRLS
jgi:EAL domain-containing protein (putative c-di-GMP-specific phosphodiesterase class I)